MEYKINYYQQYLATFGDNAVTFDRMVDGEVRYKGKFENRATLYAIKQCMDVCYFDIVASETIKLREFKFPPDIIRLVRDDVILYEFKINDLYNLQTRLGPVFKTNDFVNGLIKVTYDTDSIFALQARHISSAEQPAKQYSSQLLGYMVESLESELEKQILNGNGDKYRIATYKDTIELNHSNLENLTKGADIQNYRIWLRRPPSYKSELLQ